MPTTEAKREANKRYFAKSWSQVKLAMPNDEAEALRLYCADHGLTVAGFIRDLVRSAIAADSVQGVPRGSFEGAVLDRVSATSSHE